MLDLRGKILMLAFFTLSGFTCYRETTFFDEFTLISASSTEYPDGYYRVIVVTDFERYTTIEIPCGKTENFYLKYNTTHGYDKYLDRNQCLYENENLQAENEVIELNSRPFLDLLNIHFTQPGDYIIALKADSCMYNYYGNDIIKNQRLTVKTDTSVLIGVIPDSSQYLRIDFLGAPIYENTVKTGSSIIDINL